jgi:hypothetical protein
MLCEADNQSRSRGGVMHHRCCFRKTFFPLLIFILVFTVTGSSQTVIREEINLDASFSAARTQADANDGSCNVPPSTGYTSFYFTVGGRVVVRPSFPGTMELGYTVTLTSSHGLVFQGSVGDFYGQTIPVGTFAPGERLSFSIEFQHPYASTVRGMNPEASGSYGTLGAQSMGGSYLWHGFDTRYTQPSFTYSLSIRLYPDLSTAIDLRSPTGPPRQPCPVVAPISGDIVASYVPNGYGGDLPVFNSKSDSLYITPDLGGLTLNFGHVNAGDTLVYSLISGSPNLMGQKVYPRWQANPWPWTVPFWYMEYEDWIDNDFLDYFTYTWVTPAKYLVSFDKPNASPGDTVRVFIDPVGFSENPSEPMDLNITEGRGISVLQDTLGTFSAKDIYGRLFSHVRKELRVVISSPAPPPVIAKIAGTSAVEQTQAADPTRVIVQVFDDNDNTKTGRGVIALGKKKQLKIVDHSPWEIWPDLVNKTSKSGVTGYSPKRSFLLEVLDGSGKPIAGEEIEIKTTFKNPSGGHQHNSSPFDQSRQGKFFGQKANGNPLRLVSSPDGTAIVDSLIASEIAGEYLVTARLVNDTTVNDTVNLIAKVLNLLDFTGEGKYSLTGSKTEHARNHFVFSQNTIDTLILAANKFASLSWNTTGHLKINDNSLAWGGLFDVKTDWKTPHSLHRVGKSVDIENIVLKDTTVTFTTHGAVTTKAVKVADADWLSKFTNLMLELRWRFEDEEQTIPNEQGRVLFPHFEWGGN